MASYNILFKKSAAKDFKSIPKMNAKRLIAATCTHKGYDWRISSEMRMEQ